MILLFFGLAIGFLIGTIMSSGDFKKMTAVVNSLLDSSNSFVETNKKLMKLYEMVAEERDELTVMLDSQGKIVDHLLSEYAFEFEGRFFARLDDLTQSFETEKEAKDWLYDQLIESIPVETKEAV